MPPPASSYNMSKWQEAKEKRNRHSIARLTKALPVVYPVMLVWGAHPAKTVVKLVITLFGKLEIGTAGATCKSPLRSPRFQPLL